MSHPCDVCEAPSTCIHGGMHWCGDCCPYERDVRAARAAKQQGIAVYQYKAWDEMRRRVSLGWLGGPQDQGV